MAALIFAPTYDSEGKRDATGAFHPEAHRFRRFVGAERVTLFDNRAEFYERRETVYNTIENRARASVDVVAFFCHGFRTGLQAGLGLEHLRRFALTLKPCAAPSGLTVLLYACDAARDSDRDRDDDRRDGVGGDGGFADRLRDALGEVGVLATVYAHATAGHTTSNPWLRVFRSGESAGGPWVVAPGSELWPAWRRALDPVVERDGRRVVDESRDLRFRFWRMSQAEIEAELRART